MRIQRRTLRSSSVLSISYALIGRSMSAPKIMISIDVLAMDAPSCRCKYYH